MIQSFGEMLGAAAIALVEPDYVEAREPGLFRRAEDVSRFTRSLKPMEQHERRMFVRILLPVTFTAHLGSGFHFELPRYTRWQTRKCPLPKGGGDGHQVAIAKAPVGLEFFHHILC